MQRHFSHRQAANEESQLRKLAQEKIHVALDRIKRARVERAHLALRDDLVRVKDQSQIAFLSLLRSDFAKIPIDCFSKDRSMVRQVGVARQGLWVVRRHYWNCGHRHFQNLERLRPWYTVVMSRWVKWDVWRRPPIHSSRFVRPHAARNRSRVNSEPQFVQRLHQGVAVKRLTDAN